MNNTEFDQLVKEHRKYLFGFVYKKVNYDESFAEEICQETLIKAFKHLQRSEIKVQTMKPWLCQIACNLIVDHYRKSLRKKTFSIDQKFGDQDYSQILESDFKISDVENKLFLDNELSHAFEALKGKSYDLFKTFMTYLETDDYDKTSKIEDICIGTTKSRIFRARQILKENLPKDLVALIAD